MTTSTKKLLILTLTILTIIFLFLFPPIAQPLSFHHFADNRSFWGIQNFGNVASNLPFIFVGSYGLLLVRRAPTLLAIRIIYNFLFTGVILTGLGSAYYHCNPNNDTLLWDRIPMTIVFMSLLSATFFELVDRPLGARLLFPLVAVGIASVIWWHFTESIGKGDLRPYFWVQFYPMLAIPLLFVLFYRPSLLVVVRCLAWVIIWYVIAKVFEQLDYPIYVEIGVGGHTLKHLAASVSTWYFVLIFQRQYSQRAPQSQ